MIAGIVRGQGVRELEWSWYKVLGWQGHSSMLVRFNVVVSSIGHVVSSIRSLIGVFI